MVFDVFTQEYGLEESNLIAYLAKKQEYLKRYKKA